ncbi:hypothetical protein L0936_19385 [Paracidovorax citrulli]
MSLQLDNSLGSRNDGKTPLCELSYLSHGSRNYDITSCFHCVFLAILEIFNAPISRKIVFKKLQTSPNFSKGLVMKKEDIFVFSLGWLAANTPQLVELLKALFPVIVVAVLGYAIHLIGRDKGGKK